MIDKKLIRLAFYESSDGPRVMLFGPMAIEIESLQDTFRDLSNGDGPFCLERLPYVYAAGSVGLQMITCGDFFDRALTDSIPGIRRVNANSQKFIWMRTNQGWEYLAKLLDGLVDSSSPGHQYLTRYPDEDAIVVVSRGEYGDEVLNRG